MPDRPERIHQTHQASWRTWLHALPADRPARRWGLYVVDTDSVLLVASMSRAQDLRKLPERLRAEGLEEYL
jgi:hypothetical protein